MGKDADGVLRQGGCIEKRSRALRAARYLHPEISRHLTAGSAKLTLTINNQTRAFRGEVDAERSEHLYKPSPSVHPPDGLDGFFW